MKVINTIKSAANIMKEAWQESNASTKTLIVSTAAEVGFLSVAEEIKESHPTLSKVGTAAGLTSYAVAMCSMFKILLEEAGYEYSFQKNSEMSNQDDDYPEIDHDQF